MDAKAALISERKTRVREQQRGDHHHYYYYIIIIVIIIKMQLKQEHDLCNEEPTVHEYQYYFSIVEPLLQTGLNAMLLPPTVARRALSGIPLTASTGVARYC